MTDRDNDRLLDLEMRYTHLERLVGQLNEVVTEQQDELDRLRRRLATMREELRSGGEPAEGDDPPPPHY